MRLCGNKPNGQRGHVMATILYARVSTAEQTIDHQLAHAKAAGFSIDEVVADNGVSGLHTRIVERPEGRRLCTALCAVNLAAITVAADENLSLAAHAQKQPGSRRRRGQQRTW